MKIYALLVGINDYPLRPLRQCVGDVGKMEEYLRTLATQDRPVEILTLTNAAATRDAVISGIRDHLSKASDEDVALLYYSGHGAQEQSAGLFPEEQDGLLECLVCYSRDSLDTGQMIADQELRYLFHKLPGNPHLVTVIDACHSGDIVRAFHPGNGMANEEMKRISGTFEARKYADFVFSQDPAVKRPRGRGFEVYIPYKNHVHVGACLSSESSWEDSDGGVFTRYLLHLLESTQGRLSYADIARWGKISLHSVTKKQQTPLITVQGKGPMHAQLPWLNLHPDGVTFPDGMLVNNKTHGWVYSRGSLLGVQPGMDVYVSVTRDDVVSIPVKSTALDHAVVDIPDALINVLDISKTYPARTELTTYSPVRVAINAIDPHQNTESLLECVMQDHEHVEHSDRANADFFLNVFNDFVYLSLPEHEFQPLAAQISVAHDDVKARLEEQLRAIVKWHHFLVLENPGKDYENCPLEITAVDPDGKSVDVTNGLLRMDPQRDRLAEGEQYQSIQIKVRNASREKLYVGILALGSDFGITSQPFDGRVIELDPGKSKTFYDHEADNLVYAVMEQYKEVYNWKEEWFYYKIIYNNYEDFTAALTDKDYLQPPLDPPLTIQPDRMALRGDLARGERGRVKEVKKKWGTCKVRIELANGTYNMITGDLEKLLPQYVDSPELAPFIKELYFEQYYNGKTLELRPKQNKEQSAEEAYRATDSRIVKLLNRLYNFSRRRKFRRQKHHDGPVVVAEGDSWFLYPKPGVRDTLDYIMDHYRLLSLADAGDEIADYVANKELLEAVLREEPDYVLISGGGNDILGEEVIDILKDNVKDGKKAEDFLKMDVFREKLEALRNAYVMFFEKILALRPGVRIFIHGYDYVRSDPDTRTIKNGWANRYMIAKGMDDPKDRKVVISFLVDSFNDMLAGFDTKYDHVTYVNHRGTVGVDEWMDEIHPNNTGYGKVAANFLQAMQTT